MAVRSSMTELIARIRLMTGDATGVNEVFTDQQIQDMLDRHRTDWRYVELQAVQTVAPGGIVSYLDFYADHAGWERDATFVDSGYNLLTPSVSDWLAGKWTFASEPARPVLITGKTFEIYSVCVELLEAWSGKLALDFDFSAGGQSFSRSQKQAQLLNLARRYGAMREPAMAQMIRNDLN